MLTIEQHEKRYGKITASQAYRICGARGLGQGGKTYMRELIAESRGMTKAEIFTHATDWGNQWEPVAIGAYEKHTGLKVTESDVRTPEWNKDIACTPDGIVEQYPTGLEVKCPENGSVHIAFQEIKNGEDLKKMCNDTNSPTVKHVYWQIMFSIWITGYKFWHFASFHPFDEVLKLWIVPVYRNDEDIKYIESRVTEALQIKQEIINKIK